MGRVVHFELPADNAERAIKFYSHVFGWQFHKWEGPTDYWLITTGAKEQPGIDGGLRKRMQPGEGTCNTVDVSSVDEFAAKIVKEGGKIALPKMAIPTVGWLAYAIDPEGNIFGIMQRDPAAK
jgi:predicted enzyme related to lactoylglutathione lyase